MQVLLRDLVEKIKSHLRAGQYSDALALAHHILRYFPKHLETYQLLAEINLETKDLAAAADLFQRVRSADPENIVALLGLAIVHEHRHELEEAIWYLERAFEIQPMNPELREELLRLYAEQEGAPRPHLKLTPGALARLYARQGLYPQAIQEFRTLLRADPARYDLQVALAETLYRQGRKQEAAETAQALLEKLPLCLKANLLLGTLWRENDVPEAEMFLQRAQALDPERTMARELHVDHWTETTPPTLPPPGTEPASAALSLAFDLKAPIEVERPAAEAQTLATSEQAAEPEVLTSPGPLAETASEVEPQPDKTVDLTAPAAANAVKSDTAIEPQPVEPVHALDMHPTLPEAAPVIQGAVEKLPSWLRGASVMLTPAPASQQPTPVSATGSPPEGPTAEDETADWLTRMRGVARRGETEASGGEEGVPDWLREPERPTTNDATSETTASDANPPTWLENLGDDAPPLPPESEVQVPDWLKPEIVPSEPAVEVESDDSMPEWLLQGSPAQAQPLLNQPVETATSAVESKDLAVEETAASDSTEPGNSELQAVETVLAEAETEQPVAVEPETLLKRAHELVAHGDIIAALELYEKASQREPRFIPEVIADLEQLVKEPDAPLPAHRLLGDAYSMVGRFKEALEQYRVVLGR
jgi:tetratricopeptide (TPR) repeat protein